MASITDANAFKPPPRRKRGALAMAAIWVAAAMVVLAAFWTVMLNFVARPYPDPVRIDGADAVPGGPNHRQRVRVPLRVAEAWRRRRVQGSAELECGLQVDTLPEHRLAVAAKRPVGGWSSSP